MRAEILDEPPLEFGGGSRHVDPRYGILAHGPADLNSPTAPTAIRVGVVGPADQSDGLRSWFDRCRTPIVAKDDSYPHLFPPFPGCNSDRGLYTQIGIADRNVRHVPDRQLRALEGRAGTDPIREAVAMYAAEIAAMAEEHRVDVIVVARPDQLTDTRTRARGRARRTAPRPRIENFHDMLKARTLHLGIPLQIIRRSTWDEATSPQPGRGRQDEATRAWNLHIAMYYKAGGVPWRLPRTATDYTTCYIGVSFYRGNGSDRLDTAVAHVFNERGDGVIVRGGQAQVTGDDKQPHLTEADAYDLLQRALNTYRTEHKTLPARVVFHKSSRYTDGEIRGFDRAAADRDLAALDLIWITDSEDVQLFRPGAAPPLRGTFLTLDTDEHALYTKASVEFYSTYPGMYIPRPLGLRPALSTRSPRDIAADLLALSKMNWNQAQLDGRLPITLRTAEQVKKILRFCEPDQAVASRYAQYM